MFTIFLADGFEPVEAIAPLDFLRRAGVETQTVALNPDRSAEGNRGVRVRADLSLDEFCPDDSLTGVLLPGGMPGAENLFRSAGVNAAVDFAAANGKVLAAICAAPFVLGQKGLLRGKRATCFPGFEDKLTGATVVDASVVTDGNVVTARGAGVSWQFAAAVTALLAGEETARRIMEQIQWEF